MWPSFIIDDNPAIKAPVSLHFSQQRHNFVSLGIIFSDLRLLMHAPQFRKLG